MGQLCDRHSPLTSGSGWTSRRHRLPVQVVRIYRLNYILSQLAPGAQVLTGCFPHPYCPLTCSLPVICSKLPNLSLCGGGWVCVECVWSVPSTKTDKQEERLHPYSSIPLSIPLHPAMLTADMLWRRVRKDTIVEGAKWVWGG